MNIQPLGDRVLIEPISSEEKTKSGIVLPDTAEKEKPEQGKIVAVGTGKILDDGSRQPLELKKSDVVLFSKYGPTEIRIGTKDYLIAREDDILAIVG